MIRSKLKNIINKASQSKLSPFELFKNSIPKEVTIGENYRLEDAWKAYGFPKNYKEALWQGLMLPVNGNIVLPSIGYNEETDSYEYLNKGKENDTVAKDIRAWDNDVIPFIKELKLGGYVRTFNEEKDCWTYSKNKSLEVESLKLGGKKKIKIKTEDGYIEVDSLDEDLREGRKPIGKDKMGRNLYMKGDGTAGPNYGGKQSPEFFLKGGKTSKKKDWNTYYEFLETLPKNLQKGNDTDTFEGYRMKFLFDNTPDLWTFEDGLKGENPIFTKQEDGYHASSVIKMSDGHYEFLKSYRHPSFLKEIEWYNSDDGKSFREQYRLKSKNDQGVPLVYYQYIPNNPQAFKQGGQMNVIPEGALHAHKNHMELAKEGEITSKGIPVISKDEDGNIVQHAEVEREELTLTKEVTDKVESWYNKFFDDNVSLKDKDEIAIKCGKYICKEILFNTDDRTGLIEKLFENGD